VESNKRSTNIIQNAFNATMNMREDISKKATCTSCTFAEDFSNYWTAVMYFRARNGTFKRVPQMGNQFLERARGGMTIYYIPPYDGKSKTTAFRPVRQRPVRKAYGDLTVAAGFPYAHRRSG
jgi:hypothetical protein